MIYSSQFLYILISIVGLILSQVFSRNIVRILFDKIFTATEKLYEKKEFKKIIKDELLNLKAVKEKKNYLSSITTTIGVIEFLAFYFGSLLILLSVTTAIEKDFFLIPTHLAKILGAWLAIKTIGNYNQWSSPI